jgi:transcriptional regulator with XRE-family HTH domain
MEQLNSIIGANIKHFRKAVKMSTTTLGELSNTSQSTISKIENGSSTSIEILIQICDALKISLKDILPAGLLPEQPDHSGKRQLLGLLDELTDAEIKTIQLLLSVNILPVIKQITPLLTALDELDEKSRNNLHTLLYSILNNR